MPPSPSSGTNLATLSQPPPVSPPSPRPHPKEQPAYLAQFSGMVPGVPPSPLQRPRRLGRRGLRENTRPLVPWSPGRGSLAGTREVASHQVLTCPILGGPFHTKHCAGAGGSSRRRRKANRSPVSPHPAAPSPCPGALALLAWGRGPGQCAGPENQRPQEGASQPGHSCVSMPLPPTAGPSTHLRARTGEKERETGRRGKRRREEG